MNQRKCGTCKYFEEGGIASSGWCKHPDRQDLEHMVLVRKTELACRNGWDDDLWEPRELGASPQSAVVSPRPQDSASKGSPSQERPIMTPGHKNPNPLLNGHSRPGVTEDPAKPIPSIQDSGRRSDQALDAWSSSFEAALGGQRTDVDEVQGESVSRRFVIGEDSGRGQPEGFGNQNRLSDDSEPAPPVFRNEPDSRGTGDSGPIESSKGYDDRDRKSEPGPVQQSGLTEPFELDPSEAQQSSDFGIFEVDQQFDVPPGMDDSEQYTDSSTQSQLPMAGQENACCRNCRDFLPSKGSRNGWCSNPYAFGKRTEVSGDTVACQSTFGSWWSPSDDWWMERADIAHHSAPTPLVDIMIRQLRDREIDERGSTHAPDRS